MRVRCSPARAIAPFRALATPLADTVGPKSYPEMFEWMGPGPDEEVARSLFIDSVDSRVAEKIAASVDGRALAHAL